MLLTSFRLLRPRYETSQEEILTWLADVHCRAEATAARSAGETFDPDAFLARTRRLIRHVCCGSDRIAMRGYSASDREHAETEATALYDVSQKPAGAGMSARTDLYAREVEIAFERLYADETQAPDDLVHVTCTGYVSPSGAQQLVARRGWSTRVTHAYHMGCYASVPALRIASGLARSGKDVRVDVVHTELCSLHFDPSIHTPEQLVVQSLFADGHARYTLRDDAHGEPALRIMALHEVLSSGSEDAMQWRLGDNGMRMSLSRDLPAQLARSIRPFVTELLAKAGLDLATERTRCMFAIHPGGPKVIDVVRDALELDERQVDASRRVLRRFGNMSSATLPHIWADMLASDEVAKGTTIVSVAFGPGLTFAGALLRKE